MGFYLKSIFSSLILLINFDLNSNLLGIQWFHQLAFWFIFLKVPLFRSLSCVALILKFVSCNQHDESILCIHLVNLSIFMSKLIVIDINDYWLLIPWFMLVLMVLVVSGVVVVKMVWVYVCVCVYLCASLPFYWHYSCEIFVSCASMSIVNFLDWVFLLLSKVLLDLCIDIN